MSKNHVVFFSPTKTSMKVARALAKGMGFADAQEHNLTHARSRESFELACATDDVVLFAFPVHAGRVPAFLLPVIQRMQGNGAKAVPIAVYGNRDIDDALLEAADLLESQGFSIAAATAFIGEHSFTAKVGMGRPDADDLAVAADFGAQIAQKLAQAGDGVQRPIIRGNVPYKELGGKMPFTPKTTADCTLCGCCVEVCPMSNIDPDHPSRVGDKCIQCNACVKVCRQNAKFFDDEPLMGIIGFLEGKCADRKEPELFL